jgi:hypothetical protein
MEREDEEPRSSGHLRLGAGVNEQLRSKRNVRRRNKLREVSRSDSKRVWKEWTDDVHAHQTPHLCAGTTAAIHHKSQSIDVSFTDGSDCNWLVPTLFS